MPEHSSNSFKRQRNEEKMSLVFLSRSRQYLGLLCIITSLFQLKMLSMQLKQIK